MRDDAKPIAFARQIAANYHRRITSDLQDDCELEASVVLWQIAGRLDRLHPTERTRYSLVCIRRAVWRMLRKELTYRRVATTYPQPQLDALMATDTRTAVTHTQLHTLPGLIDLATCPTVIAALRKLSRGDFEILELAIVRDFTDEELGAHLRMSAAAACKRRQRALRKLRLSIDRIRKSPLNQE